jgi:CheY-like chemotaxis protein
MITSLSPKEVTSSTTVLFIDDDAEDLQHWSNALHDVSPSYSILKALNGQAGLDLCRYQKVDCVVLDLDLPDSGFKVLFDLIPDRTRPKIAVVMLTRLHHPVLHEMALHNGAQACLIKQLTTATTLDEAIRKAVASVEGG